MQEINVVFGFADQAKRRVNAVIGDGPIPISSTQNFLIPPVVGDLVILPGLEGIGLMAVAREWKLSTDGKVFITILLDLTPSELEKPALSLMGKGKE